VFVWAKDSVGNIGGSSFSNIFIDLTEITFENFTPSSNDWLASRKVNCTIQIFDREGFGVNSGNILYWDIQNKKWEEVTEVQFTDPRTMNITVRTEQNEGTESYIKFRATDLAGNGPTESKVFYFKIDTIPVSFIDAKPDPWKAQASERLKCRITIQDLGGSGVNLSTIQFSYTTNGLDNFHDWTDSGLAMKFDENNAEESSTWFVDLDFKRGSENYIRWRAMDLADNGWTISEPISVWVNALPTIIISEIDLEKTYYSDKEIEIFGDETYDIDNQNSDLEFTWLSNISGEIGKGKILTTKLDAGDHRITLRVFDGLNNASYSFNLTVKDPKSEENGLGIFGLGQSADYILIVIIIVIIILLILFSILYKREKKRRRQLEERERHRAHGPEISYIPPRGPLAAGGLEPGAGFGAQASGFAMPGASGDYSITDSQRQIPGAAASPYGQSPQVTHLPGVGGTVGGGANAGTFEGAGKGAGGVGITPRAVGINAGTGTGPSASAGVGTVGRQVPQLPPAQVVVTSTSNLQNFEQLHPKKKMELLEQKMLTGEIPVELYTKLSIKYEQELKSRLVPQQPKAPAPPKVQLPVTQGQPRSQSVVKSTATPSSSPSTSGNSPSIIQQRAEFKPTQSPTHSPSQKPIQSPPQPPSTSTSQSRSPSPKHTQPYSNTHIPPNTQQDSIPGQAQPTIPPRELKKKETNDK
jgi:hypothetical protein